MRVAGRITYKISLVGMLAAVLECVKLSLAMLPNIEAVTLFVSLFSYVFGWAGFLATVIFVIIEPLIWGFGAWVISYILYWPVLSLAFIFLGRIARRGDRIVHAGRVIPTAIALIFTLWFGVLSSLVEVGLFSGSFDNFTERFGIYYMRGIVFYALQLGCNAVLFPLCFPYFARLLSRLRPH